jgi:hypothetical protein
MAFSSSSSSSVSLRLAVVATLHGCLRMLLLLLLQVEGVE